MTDTKQLPQWAVEAAAEVNELHNLTDEHDADVASIIAKHSPHDALVEVCDRIIERWLEVQMHDATYHDFSCTITDLENALALAKGGK